MGTSFGYLSYSSFPLSGVNHRKNVPPERGFRFVAKLEQRNGDTKRGIEISIIIPSPYLTYHGLSSLFFWLFFFAKKKKKKRNPFGSALFVKLGLSNRYMYVCMTMKACKKEEYCNL